MSDPREAFISAWDALARAAHENSAAKGFWAAIPDSPVGDAVRIGLMHSELSEGLEAMRAGNPPDDKIPQFSGVEAELADVVIRIMDVAHARRWNVAGAVVAKMAMNAGRSMMHGGKAF